MSVMKSLSIFGYILTIMMMFYGNEASASSENKSRGIRIDPAYFYDSHPGKKPKQIVKDVVKKLKAAKVNTIYLYAYNAVYGAYYPTDYSLTEVEKGYGKQNIFGELVKKAKASDIKVVAVIPLNNFKSVWQKQPQWRVKENFNKDYKPSKDTFLLSASVQPYKKWYGGLIDDLIKRHPSLQGVEVVEPTIDYHWSQTTDQNPAAVSLFKALYPFADLDSQEWKDFRAFEFLKLIAFFNKKVHAHNKKTYLVHTWTVDSKGNLIEPQVLKDNSGFDFLAVARLQGALKTDYLIGEFIWQQWQAEHGDAKVFNPSWIAKVGNQFKTILRKNNAVSEPIVHVEISEFKGSKGNKKITKKEFRQTMKSAKKLNTSLSVYDFNQIFRRKAFQDLAAWN